MVEAKTNQSKTNLKENAGCALGFGAMTASLLVIGWQAYVWLKTGHWPNIPLASAIAPVFSGSDFWIWFVAPHSWQGLHGIVKFLFELPLFLWLMACSALAFHALLP